MQCSEFLRGLFEDTFHSAKQIWSGSRLYPDIFNCAKSGRGRGRVIGRVMRSGLMRVGHDSRRRKGGDYGFEDLRGS